VDDLGEGQVQILFQFDAVSPTTNDAVHSGTGAGAPTTRQILYVDPGSGPLMLDDTTMTQITRSAMASKPCTRTVKLTGDR
jgi:hypothetical protein